TDQDGCTASTTRAVTIGASPSVSIAPATVNLCAGQSTTLTATGSGGTNSYTYQWTGGPNTATYYVSPASDITYTVVVTDNNGCTASNTRAVNVNNAPTVTIAPATVNLCAGQSTTLTATGSGGGGSPYTYQWTGGPATATYNVSPASDITYTVVVTDN